MSAAALDDVEARPNKLMPRPASMEDFLYPRLSEARLCTPREAGGVAVISMRGRIGGGGQ